MDNDKAELTRIYSILSLHHALLAVLYADHIEHDKKLRDVTQNATESLQAFRNYTNEHLKPMAYAYDDAMRAEVGQAAMARVQGFFRDVESLLLSRGTLDKPDPVL